jgi:hypothetical protein
MTFNSFRKQSYGYLALVTQPYAQVAFEATVFQRAFPTLITTNDSREITLIFFVLTTE